MGKKSVLALLILFTAAFFCSTDAEDANTTWDSLKQLAVGQKIQIVEMSLKDHQGTFVAFTGDTIEMDVQGKRTGYQRDSILRVSSRGPSKRGRHALYGTAIGAGAGAIIGYLAGASYHEEGEEGVFMLVFTPIGAGVGALTGASLPAHDYRVIYRAQPRPPIKISFNANPFRK